MSKWMLVLLFVAGAALSWGNYVPMVHVAAQQLKSNLRAFLFVGIAYFLVAVLIPGIMIFLLKWDPTEKGTANFDFTPSMWGIAAGVCRRADHQHHCHDHLLSPREDAARLAILPRAGNGSRWSSHGDAVQARG